MHRIGMSNVLAGGGKMIQTSEGVWSWNGWTITVWLAATEGMWHYRATSRSDHKKGIVQAWDEQSAADMVALELAE